jgi:hypothetical protein
VRFRLPYPYRQSPEERLVVRLRHIRAQRLTPIAFAAAILGSPWRDADASKFEGVVATIKARLVEPVANVQNALHRLSPMGAYRPSHRMGSGY